MPSNDAGDGGGGAGDGGRDASALQVAEAVRAEWGMDQGSAGRGRERAHAPHDLHGGGQAQVVRASPRHRRPRRLLQCLLLGLLDLSQVFPPHGWLPGGGGHPLLH